MSQPDSSECRFPLDDSTSATLVLPDGRKLGFAEYGSPTGQPILYAHGFIASRIEATLLHHAASAVGARLIAIDRPGHGWSSPHPTRTMKTYADDVEALTKHLNIPRYGVLGISGGGPYALACARYLPASQLRAVGLVCGLGCPDMGYRGMQFPNWCGWTFGQRLFPGFCRWWLSREPAARLDLTADDRFARLRAAFRKHEPSMHPKDRAWFGDADFTRAHVRTAQEAFGQGMDGPMLDFRVLNSDFGFRVEDVRKDLPVALWYGRLDRNVPLQHGEKIAARIGPGARLHVSDDTHVSVSQELKEKYLRELVKAIES